MTIQDLECWQALHAEPARQLARHRPTLLTANEWASLRADAICLVACCEPKTELDARTMVSTLARFLAELRSESPALHTDLVTALNVTRILDRWEAQGMNSGTRGQHRARLNRFLRVKAGHPGRTVKRQATPRDLEPYSDDDLALLLEAVDMAPDHLRRVGVSAIVLGAVYGIVMPRAGMVTGDTSRGLSVDGKPVARPARVPTILSEREATGFSDREWVRLTQWMRRNQEGIPSLRIHRLRDTWLLGPMQDPATALPASRLMHEFGVGRCLIEHLARLPVRADPTQYGPLLRDS